MSYYIKTSVPSASKLSLRTSLRISSEASMVCSLQVSPLSDLRITISRSLPRSAAKCGTSIITGLQAEQKSQTISITSSKHFVQYYPKNLAPTGPNSNTLLAKASPSIKGGGCGVLWGLTYLHVILVGLGAHLGGTITLTPEWRHPLIAPPRASTRNETRKL